MASSCGKVRSYASWLSSAMRAQGRDASHGMQHFERVRAGALRLAGDELASDEGRRLLLELAALSHDVLDHKYDSGDRSGLRLAMERALGRLAGLDAEQIRDVCLIADNVSLSKELRGELDVSALRRRGILGLRDLVSDADKLDALGRRGLQRLAQYQAHLMKSRGQPASLLTGAFLRSVARDHLLHRAAYLRTEAGRAQGQRLLHETCALLASDVELAAIIAAVQRSGADAEPRARRRGARRFRKFANGLAGACGASNKCPTAR